tara:strand:- start:450 stop:1649 length:1200 start_codon:yes stop_codon:yes gene_type:complete
MTQVLELCPTPPANAFVSKKFLSQSQPVFPLKLFFCESCSHVQLVDIVNPELLFKNYVYVSGTSPVFISHFHDYAETIIKSYVSNPEGQLVLDIGSNDGTLLKEFKKYGMRVLGVDPAQEISVKACNEGVETLNAFFTRKLAHQIRVDYGAAKVVTANNVFAHSDELIDITNGIHDLLAPDGVFVFEVSYLADVFQGTLFDTIYHEHLAYHSVKPLQHFFKKHGLEMIAAKRVKTHGGSLRGIVQLANGPREIDASIGAFIKEEADLGLHKASTLHSFGVRIGEIKEELRCVLKSLKEEGKTIGGFGAPAKATTLMHHFDIGPDIIDFIVDDSQLKQGLYSPGMHIPIIGSSAIYKKKPDVMLILAWNFSKSIMKDHREYLRRGGTFVVPLPKVEIFKL